MIVIIFPAGNDIALVKLERTNDNKALIIAAARLDRETVAKQLLTVKCFKYNTTPKLNKAYNRLVSVNIFFYYYLFILLLPK